MNDLKKITFKKIIKNIINTGNRAVSGLEINKGTICGPNFYEIKGVKDKTIFNYLGISRYDFIKICLTFNTDDLIDTLRLMNKDWWENSELLMYCQGYSVRKHNKRLDSGEYHYSRKYNKHWEN